MTENDLPAWRIKLWLGLQFKTTAKRLHHCNTAFWSIDSHPLDAQLVVLANQPCEQAPLQSARYGKCTQSSLSPTSNISFVQSLKPACAHCRWHIALLILAPQCARLML
eukprot:UN4093